LDGKTPFKKFNSIRDEEKEKMMMMIIVGGGCSELFLPEANCIYSFMQADAPPVRQGNHGPCNNDDDSNPGLDPTVPPVVSSTRARTVSLLYVSTRR
jgi:hypothetical protein